MVEMPQPLSHQFKPDASISIAGSGVPLLRKHPHLASLALEAIASWSHVEFRLLRLFLVLLGGADTVAAASYLALEGQSAKMRAIRAGARVALHDRQQLLPLLEAILAIAKTNERARNKLAHWAWGEVIGDPEVLLLVDPREPLDSINRDAIYVYREVDFLEIVHANDRLCRHIWALRFIIEAKFPDRVEQHLRELTADSEIADRLTKQVSGKSNVSA